MLQLAWDTGAFRQIMSLPKSPVGGKCVIKPETLPFQPIYFAVLFGNGGKWSNPLFVAVQHVHEKRI
jgi:hypothetical protein